MPEKRARSPDDDAKIVVRKELKVGSLPLTALCSQTATTAVSNSSHASDTEPHAQPQAQSHFFGLPWELRSLIYTITLAKPPTSDTLLDLTHPDAQDAEPPFLLTCRRARREALPIFYSSNDWVVKTRRVNNLRIDPDTNKPVLYEIIPRWANELPEEKLMLLGRIVVVGTRGSFVDGEGRWREGGRAGFRLRFTGRGKGWVVEEVFGEDDTHGIVRARESRRNMASGECGIQLVDLLRAKLRSFSNTGNGRKWTWNRAKIEQIAIFL